MSLNVKQIDRLAYLRKSMIYDALKGQYKSFKESKKEYASLAVKNFDKLNTLPAHSISVSLFSRQGLNMMYVALRELFRVKSQDEKLLKKMGYEALKKKNLDSTIARYSKK